MYNTINNSSAFQADKVWFSSDWHLFHHNILKYDKRPFKDINEMNEMIISNHSLLTASDHLFYLGDLTYGDPIKTRELLDRLKCKIYFIRGNHDKALREEILRKRFEWIRDLTEIQIIDSINRKYSLVLCHYAMRVWNKSHHGAWHLYGHSHHSLPDDLHSLSFDVGVNGWNYKPISFDLVKQKMSLKVFKPIDHHVVVSK